MKHQTRALALALAVMSSVAVQADAPSYSFVEVDLPVGGILQNNSGLERPKGGYGLKGSFGFADAWFVDVGYSMSKFGGAFIFGDLTHQHAYIGWHDDHLYAKLGFERAEDDGYGSDGGGLAVELGFRTALNEEVELYGRIGQGDAGLFGAFTRFGIGAVIEVTDRFEVTFDFTHEDINEFDAAPFDVVTINVYGIGARYSF